MAGEPVSRILRISEIAPFEASTYGKHSTYTVSHVSGVNSARITGTRRARRAIVDVCKNKDAQNSDKTAAKAKRVIGRPFPKGTSGNPGGRPKKRLIDEVLEELLLTDDSAVAQTVAAALLKKAKRGDVKAIEITREQILDWKIEERLAARSHKNDIEKGRSDGRLPSLATGKIRLAASTEWGSENPGETRQARC